MHPAIFEHVFRVHLIGHLLCEFELFVEISAVDLSLLAVDELPDLSDELPDVPPEFPPDLIMLHISISPDTWTKKPCCTTTSKRQ